MINYHICRMESPDGNYLCTERIPEGNETHLGDHVAGGRAEGERDSVIASWAQ